MYTNSVCPKMCLLPFDFLQSNFRTPYLPWTVKTLYQSRDLNCHCVLMVPFFFVFFIRLHRHPLTQIWGSPSFRAIFLPTLTLASHQITLLSRRCAQPTTQSHSTLRRNSLCLEHGKRRKASASTLTRSWTCPCYSCTVRCHCAPKALRTSRHCHR